MRLIGWIAAALLFAGCGKGTDGPGDECSLDDAPTLEIGISDNGFVSVDDAGGEAVLVYGAQGGYHLELSFRATGLDTSQLVSVVTTGTLNGEERALTNSWEQFRCNPDTNTEDAWNIRLIYDAEPDELGGATTDIDALVEDGNGTTFTASTTLTILDPEAP